MPEQSNTTPGSLAFEYFLLAILALMWGGSYALLKLAVETITPVTLVVLRVTLAACLLWLFVFWKRYPVPTDVRAWSRLLGQATIGLVIPFTLITWCQQYVDSGLAGILNSTSPVFAFLITALWTRHEQLSASKLSGALVGLAGVVLIVGVDALRGLGTEIIAQLAIVLATVSYGMAAISGKRFVAVSPVVTAAATLSLAALVLTPVGLLIETPFELNPSSQSIWALITLAAFSTAGAFVLYYRLMNTIGTMGTTSVAYLRAGIAVLIGALFLGESLSWTIGLGLAAVVIGVAALNGQLRLPVSARPTHQ